MVRTFRSILLSSFVTIAGGAYVTCNATAQDAAATPNPGLPLVAEGVPDAESVTIDKKRRSPVVSIGTDVVSTTGASAQTKILVDAFVPAEEYKDYPIEFKFFINGLLRETQIRSRQLPRDVGIVVKPDVATPPFNWTIVATLLHPNRQFVTVAQGAVFGRDLGETYSCTLTLNSVSTDGSDGTIYVADDITASQLSNSEVSLNFVTSQLEDGSEAAEVTTSATLSFSGTSASGTVTTSLNGTASTVNVSGTTEGDDGAVDSFNVATSDGLTRLECE